MARRMRGMLDRVAAFPLPVIAALNGHALGGGAEVAIAADIRIAADDVRIGFNQVSLGHHAGLGRRRAARPTHRPGPRALAIATGELYAAAAARDIGLVDLVVPRASFEDEWQTLALKMAQAAPGATRAIKAVVAAAAPTTHQDLEAAAADEFARLWIADAHWDAVDAMQQKRKKA